MLLKEGDRFGRLVVLSEAGKDRHRKTKVRCKCDCGNFTVVEQGGLRTGNTKSCGCLHREIIKTANITHGKTYTRLYNTWRGMKDRCLNPNATNYFNYGGRGIGLFRPWFIFENFMKWALENGYQDGLTIERKDTDGDYTPDNCTWATRQEQCNNKRSNHFITFNNETKTVMEWSRLTGIHWQTILTRIFRLGWAVERALTVRPGTIKPGPKSKVIVEEKNTL